MKKAFLFVGILCFSIIVFSQSVVGKWKTVDHETGKEKSIVEVYMKNGKVYGKIIEIFNKPNPEKLRCEGCPEPWKDKPTLGLEIIKGLEKEDGGWEADDAIIDPSRKKVYDCRIWREGDILYVRGYLGWFYATQEWHLVK